MTKNQKVWPVFKRLFQYMLPMKFIFIASVIALIVYGSVDAVFVWLLKPFIDEGFAPQHTIGGEPSVDVLAWAPIVVVMLFVIRGLANFVSTYGLAYITGKLVMNLRQEIFERYLRMPVRTIDNHSAGRLIAKLTFDVEQVSGASASVLTSMIRNTVTLLAYTSVMFWYSWKLSLCIFISVPLIAILIAYVSKRFRRISAQLQQAMGGVSAVTDQVIKGHRNVLMFCAQEVEAKRFYDVNERNFSRKLKLARASAISQPLIMIIGSFSLALVLYLASLDGIRQELTAGAFASFFTAMLSLFQPLKGIMGVNNTFQQGIVAAQSVFNILDEPLERDLGTMKIDRAQGRIDFKNVTFRYEKENRAVLEQVNLSVEPGKTLALVGRSGSGKSTLTSLLARFYDDLETGKILLDGQDINDYALQDFRSQMAVVSQQVTLFDDTIYNNIAYACGLDIQREQVIEAARLAYALDFIDELPQGLDTQIGENGVRLSGGQKQRIAIARAILRNAPILILDEATSALDTESERAIQKALENLSHGRTCIVIAHRLSTVESADEIAVIDDGRVVEKGTHTALLEHSGVYAHLYNMQFGEV
tara:strand:- start:4036 stop:5805 length:1770 start_codon:yes stop_codon:yes gene_type:complete